MQEKHIKNIISKVYKNSIAEEVEIGEGDILLAINGKSVEDIIDYKFLLSEEYLEVEIIKPSGEEWLIEIDKEYDEDLGIEFENPLISEAKSCQNKCIFCFIDQLPENMRKTLYFKDDDSRLSFLHGNYITLTNMRENDLKKIIQYRISPINISVHTTNAELRSKMLGNRRAGELLKILEEFAKHHIEMNCQIVLCPNINDGIELDNTIRDLSKLSHAIKSVAIVPVGITRYREKLHQIKGFTKETATHTVIQLEEWQNKFRQGLGRGFVYLSDEFYLLSGKDFPDYEQYDGFPQLENGVGMVVDFRKSFKTYLKRISPREFNYHKKITIITGVLAHSIIDELSQMLMLKVKNLEIQVVAIENDFFGGEITVAGLITGCDILKKLRGLNLGEKIMIPQSMVKSDEDIFLDDVSVLDIEKELGIEVQVCEVDGINFINKILEGE